MGHLIQVAESVVNWVKEDSLEWSRDHIEVFTGSTFGILYANLIEPNLLNAVINALVVMTATYIGKLMLKWMHKKISKQFKKLKK